MVTGSDTLGSTSQRILRATAKLLETGGIQAVSTRAVAAAAGIQPPTLYRQFGDKEGLLDAVTTFILQRYLAETRELVTVADPVADLRRLWDLHVEFGLAHPECYQLAYGRGRPGKVQSAVRETLVHLQRAIARVADHGMLRMSVERATHLSHSCALGFVLTQIAVPPAERDPQLSSLSRENALSAILNDKHVQAAAPSALSGRAVALREALRGKCGLAITSAEQGLLIEWLNRLANHNYAAQR